MVNNVNIIPWEVTERGLKRIDEVSVNRILSHGKDGFVIISANRSEIFSSNPNTDLTPEYRRDIEKSGRENTEAAQEMWLQDRNRKADKELLNDIRAAKFAYTPVFGGYHGGDGVKDSFEPSYVVYCHGRGGTIDKSSWERLRSFAVDMCGKYKQESVYVQAPNESPVYLDCDGKQTNLGSSLNFKVNRDNEEFFTTNKRKKGSEDNTPQRFTADIRFDEMYVHRGASDYPNRMRRTKLGEVFMND